MNLRQKITLRLLILVSITLCLPLFAQQVEIPNPNLRAAIHEALNLPDGVPITQAAMRRLTKLESPGKQIQDLSGLEHAVNITWIDFRDNQITDLSPLTSLTRLEVLIMGENPISDLSPLAKLTRLSTFYVWECPIVDIRPLANLAQLRYLDLSCDHIVDIRPLANLTQLIELVMKGNEIADITPLVRLANLELLWIHENNIVNINPLANLTNLEELWIHENKIVDISPLADLTRLTELRIISCELSDISPLANLSQLKYLNLSRNRIIDIIPLSNLTRLVELHLRHNRIDDVAPLANLTNLEVLEIQGNDIENHSPLDVLSLTHFLYDEFCEMPGLPILSRMEDRDFPSIIAPWEDIPLNRPQASDLENRANYDLWWSPNFGLYFREIREGIKMAGPLKEAIRQRDENLAINPNLVFVVEIRMRDAFSGHFPDDSPYWVRDRHGNRINPSNWPGLYLINFTHPDVQEIIIQQAIAVSECGLFDGIFFDYWAEERAVLQGPGAADPNEGYFGYETEQKARDNIIQRIRVATRPDFLIMGNTNQGTIPRNAPFFNGAFMETIVPHLRSGNELESDLTVVENSLQWLEQNLREPRINGLEGWGVPTEPPDSPTNLRWMRAFTTLSLTHSDGYVLFNDGHSHTHYWYDFWDADLGRPIGGKAQPYQETEGLYIREFTNGWAVYNHSGETQEITLPGKAQGVASELVNTEHALPNLDGEMYLRTNPKNPADVNGDGVVNVLDLTIIAQGFGTDSLEGDVNGDGVVNVFDLVFVANQF